MYLGRYLLCVREKVCALETEVVGVCVGVGVCVCVRERERERELESVAV